MRKENAARDETRTADNTRGGSLPLLNAIVELLLLLLLLAHCSDSFPPCVCPCGVASAVSCRYPLYSFTVWHALSLCTKLACASWSARHPCWWLASSSLRGSLGLSDCQAAS
eukprot:GHVT01060189.1.p2 GENE.GHVT01060189.1~~GHVT01060189.1.p2  ORF type:complete len:112 (-),score=25.45 GHVT01060189.1:789-1124(-)